MSSLTPKRVWWWAIFSFHARTNSLINVRKREKDRKTERKRKRKREKVGVFCKVACSI